MLDSRITRASAALLICLFALGVEADGKQPAELAEIDALRATESTASSSVADGTDRLTELTQVEVRERRIGGLLDVAIARVGADAANAALAANVNQQFGVLDQAIADVDEHIAQLRGRREEQSVDGRIELEYTLRDYEVLLARLLRDVYDNFERGERLGLPLAERREDFGKALEARAARLADRIEVSAARAVALAERIAAAAGDGRGELEAEKLATDKRLQGLTAGLSAAVDLLRGEGHDVSAYVRLLVRTTGEVSAGLFERRVLLGLFDDWLHVTRDKLAENGPAWAFRVIVFVAIVLFFRWLGRLTGRMVRRAVGASTMNFSTLLQDFFVTLSTNVVFFFGLMIALSQLGINLAPVLAGLGVAGFIVGFALQETLSNFAAGLMILIYRPFDVGDVVEAGGVSGSVAQMSLVSTTILTFDNQQLVVPNNKIWGDVIRNVNAKPQRRVDMTFGIGYGDDIQAAQSILEDIIAQHDLVVPDPAPVIRLHQLGESSVDFIVRPWVRSADYWTVYWDVTRAVKARFDAAGISIPYPQRDVHLYAHGNNAVAE